MMCKDIIFEIFTTVQVRSSHCVRFPGRRVQNYIFVFESVIEITTYICF